MTPLKEGPTKERWLCAGKDPAYEMIWKITLFETPPKLLLDTMKLGAVATNVFRRRMHNFAMDTAVAGRNARRNAAAIVLTIGTRWDVYLATKLKISLKISLITESWSLLSCALSLWRTAAKVSIKPG